MSPSLKRLLIILDKKLGKKFLIFLAAVAVFSVTLPSCGRIRELTEGDVVAKVGKHKLYASALAEYIPDGISPEDSTSMALQYINSWATDLLFTDLAMKELPKSERDVSASLEEYRRTLLKYRYEQEYVRERLDTLVTEDEIERYYADHKDNFKLETPIMKVRFMAIAKDSPNLPVIRKKMSSDKSDDLIEADSLAFSSAVRYNDYGGRWVNAIVLSREFGTDYVTMLSTLRNGFIEMPGQGETVRIAYVAEMLKTGQTGPLDYFHDSIKDIILNIRKHRLLDGLEQDLLYKARSQENFVIY